MKSLTKDKTRSGILKPVAKTSKRDDNEVCEICGREMARDPESGEYFCPDCYYAEDED